MMYVRNAPPRNAMGCGVRNVVLGGGKFKKYTLPLKKIKKNFPLKNKKNPAEARKNKKFTKSLQKKCLRQKMFKERKRKRSKKKKKESVSNTNTKSS